MSQQLHRAAPRHWAWLIGISCLACGVDERVLQPGEVAGTAGSGASPSAGVSNSTPEGGDGAAQGDGGNSGTGNGANAGGDAATPIVLPPLVSGCADLDTDGVSDCSVTIVENATFTSDVEGWTAGEGSTLAWDANNALADAPSGCALLTADGATDIDGSKLLRASQCLTVGGGQLVIAYANTWVAAGADADSAPQAELEVSYFDAEDCSGTATGYFATPPNEATEAWVTIHAGGVTGPATQSARLDLVGVKPFRADSLSACFDNLMFKTKAQ